MLPRLVAIAVILAQIVICPPEASCAENRRPTEHEVKAAYIYNFTKFVEWPPVTSQGGGANLEVCVIEDDAVASSLAAIEGKIVGNRRIRIKRNPPLQGPRSCDLLFIGAAEKGELKQILAAVGDKAVLTVGDTKGFAQQGVMINFYTDNNRVLFEINPKAALRAGLRISSNLLRIARIVGEP